MKSEHIILVGAGGIIIREGKTLLAKRKGSHGEGMFGSFGGHVEFGESPVETVRREAREELGITLEKMQFVSCTNFQREGKHYIDLSFVVESFTGTPRIMEPDKIESVDWYDLHDLPKPLFEPVAIALRAMASEDFYFESNE